ncbi:unnamed protein product [Effrenium voratum]|nr:unnamed protein product [Effrenium voratum]
MVGGCWAPCPLESTKRSTGCPLSNGSLGASEARGRHGSHRLSPVPLVPVPRGGLAPRLPFAHGDPRAVAPGALRKAEVPGASCRGARGVPLPRGSGAFGSLCLLARLGERPRQGAAAGGAGGGGGAARSAARLRLRGERASLAHVAGDLKAWPAMRRFLAAGRPGLEEEEGLPSPSRQWWGGAARSSRLREQSQQQLFLMAKQQGLDYVTQVGASWCHTMWTTPRVYHAARLEVTKEDQLEIETTAARLRVRLTPLTPTASAALEVTLRTADLTLDVASDGDAAGRHRLSWSACLEREWVLTRWRLSASLVELCGASLHLNASLGFPLGLWVASESESARWAVCVKR